MQGARHVTSLRLMMNDATPCQAAGESALRRRTIHVAPTVGAGSGQDENGAGNGASGEVGGEGHRTGGVAGGVAESDEGTAAGRRAAEPGERLDGRRGILRAAGDAKDSFAVSTARDRGVEDQPVAGEDRRVEHGEATAVGCGVAAGDEESTRGPVGEKQPLAAALVDHRAKGDTRRRCRPNRTKSPVALEVCVRSAWKANPPGPTLTRVTASSTPTKKSRIDPPPGARSPVLSTGTAPARPATKSARRKSGPSTPAANTTRPPAPAAGGSNCS